MALGLYFHPLASYCWKVLIALYENETSFEPLLVDLGNAESREAFFKIAPLGKFPVVRDNRKRPRRLRVDHHHRIPVAAPSRPRRAPANR